MDFIDRAMAIEAINSYFGFNVEEEYGSAVQEVINSLPPAKLEPRWTPVTEQTLPRENSTVVAIGKTATWDVGNYRGHAESNIHRWYWKKNTMKDVYWWMYKKDALPKPYERSEDASNEG